MCVDIFYYSLWDKKFFFFIMDNKTRRGIIHLGYRW